MTEQQLEQKFYQEQMKYGFDPTALVKVVLENKELGLALLQIPLAMVNQWIQTPLTWEGLPSSAGYYWTKDKEGLVTISFITNGDLQIIHEQKLTGYTYAGPLAPPK